MRLAVVIIKERVCKLQVVDRVMGIPKALQLAVLELKRSSAHMHLGHSADGVTSSSLCQPVLTLFTAKLHGT